MKRFNLFYYLGLTFLFVFSTCGMEGQGSQQQNFSSQSSDLNIGQILQEQAEREKAQQFLEQRKDTRVWSESLNVSLANNEIKTTYWDQQAQQLKESDDLNAIHTQQINALKNVQTLGNNVALASMVVVYKVSGQRKVSHLNIPYIFISGVNKQDSSIAQDYNNYGRQRMVSIGNFSTHQETGVFKDHLNKMLNTFQHDVLSQQRIQNTKNLGGNPLGQNMDEYSRGFDYRFGHSEQAFLLSSLEETLLTSNPDFGEKNNFYTLSHFIDYIAISEIATPYTFEIESIGFLVSSKIDVCKICGDTLFAACQEGSYFYNRVQEIVRKKTNIKNNEDRKVTLFAQVSSLKNHTGHTQQYAEQQYPANGYFNSRANKQVAPLTNPIQLEYYHPFVMQKIFD